jgi:transglutaminase-like putative cysteine protease
MYLKIEHTLSYQYTQPVAFDALTIRLRPRPDTRQQVIKYDLDINPSPSFTTNHIDCENNALATAWFKETHENLHISACSEVETVDRDPYDFILTEPTMNHLPVAYQEPDRSVLTLYTANHGETSVELGDFLKPVLIQAKYKTVPFLNGLVTYVFNRFRREERKQGHPWAPEKTLQKGKGTCRDFAWFYVVSCRSLGLAARFVSGYHLPFNIQKKPELHAWAEVFLPGAGWIGFDPSLGLAVSPRYVSLAASYDPILTLPTSGKFWGKDPKSNLKATISIHPLD